MVPVTVTVKVPSGARGFYLAGLTAKERPRPGVTGGVAVVVRFAVPILIEILGRPMRQKINLIDVGMEFRQASAEKPSTTLVSLGIANNGGTYSRLNAFARLKHFSGGHWRTITETEFKERSIIPGVEFNLKSDIQRSLPSGKYRVEGALYVDGRRVKGLGKEIDFAGDPSVTKVAADAALDLTPTEVSITCVPGANRTAVLTVYNASDDHVNVRTALGLPPTLKGVAVGELKGEELNCAGWVKVVPDTFRLRAGGRQNIRIMAKMPNPAAMHANYYALLGLRATYTDGQNAGVTSAYICVGNKNVEARAFASPMKLTVGAMEESKYVVVGRFGNVGNVHFTPTCSAAVTTAQNMTVANLLLSGKASVMLPLEVRNFSGVLDFSRIAAGLYRLTATLEYATGAVVTTQIPIQVSVQGEQRSVEIVRPEQFERTIGIKW